MLGLENILSCALVNTLLMQLFVAGPANSGRDIYDNDIKTIKARLLEETSAWQRRDPENYELMGGLSALEMLAEDAAGRC